MGITKMVQQIEKLTGYVPSTPIQKGSPADKELQERLGKVGYRQVNYYDVPAGIAELKLNWQIKILTIETGEDVGTMIANFRKDLRDLLASWKPQA
jgi:hypothetical protein